MKKSGTKRALLLSVLSVVLCLAMLMGSTFAWFTDSVSTGVNKIVAGNLDVEMNYWNGTEYVDAADAKLFSKGLWEPGHTEVAYLQICNAGSLALEYKLGVNPDVEQVGTNKDGGSIKLSNYLVFSVIDDKNASEGTYERDEAREAAGTAMGLNSYITGDTLLNVGEEKYVALIVYMPTEVGDIANYKTGTTPPSIDLSVTLVAKQAQKEPDSFGSDYDADAIYPFEINGQTVYLQQGENGLYKNANDPSDSANYVVDQNSLKTLQELVNVPNSEVAKSNVVLAADVKMTENWEPIGDGSTSRFSGTFDGGGHQVIDMSAHNNKTYGNGFFGDISGATIKNMTFVNANVCRFDANPEVSSGNVYGIVAGYTYGDVTFENVHVKDCTLCAYGKVGAIIGMAADPGGTTRLINCSVENTVIKGTYNCGGFIGLAQNQVEMQNCTMSGVQWVKKDAADAYIEVSGLKTVTGTKDVSGIYWKYEFGGISYAFAAWSDFYNDYDNWKTGGEDTNFILEDGTQRNFDGYCHNEY